MAEVLLAKKGIKIVGAIDIDPNKVGKDLGELLGKAPIGVVISSDVDKVLSTTKPDIVVHTTTSYLKNTVPQFEQILKHGVNVVSTCEELSYPYVTEEHKASAKKLDKLAKDNDATILGTGINPGFLMDTLAITLTGPCIKVNKINITRQMNAATRRIPFQQKIGAGLTVDEFKKKIASHEISGHVGLEQSIGMVADALGWKLDETKVESPEPVVAKKAVQSDAIKVPRGGCAGTMQKAYGIKEGKAIITLDFKAYIGAEEEFDAITIDGVPPINEKISPCTHGDYGTVGITINSIPKVLKAEAGLKTMKDLPIPSAIP
jgi:4-hydroxy-tetrahydrodipicolinate reductase